jgi:hypothetical protein
MGSLFLRFIRKALLMSRALTRFFAASLAACAALAGAAFAQSAADKASDAAVACLEIVDAAARLACLEGAAREIKATRVRPETAEETTAANAATAPVVAAEGATEEELFGAEALDTVKKEKREKAKKFALNAKVVEFRLNRFGDVTAVLDNGQVWRQLQGDSAQLPRPSDDKLYTVRIKRGAVGSYVMTVNEMKRAVRVRRIK